MIRKLDGLLHGDYQGSSRGPGTEAGDGRVYEPGDDVRRIDWNLTARTERRPTCATPSPTASSRPGSWSTAPPASTSAPRDCEKRDLRTRGRGRVRVPHLPRRQPHRRGGLRRRGHRGACRRGTGRERGARAPAPPRPARPRARGQRHRCTRPCGASGALARRRGLVVVVSDLLDDGDWPRELRALAARHDVVVVHVSDPARPSSRRSGCSRSSTPRPAAAGRSRPRAARLRERFAAAAADQRAAPPRPCGRPAPAYLRCRPIATGCSTSSGSPRCGGASDDLPRPQPTVVPPRGRRARGCVRRPPASPTSLRGALHEPRPARRRWRRGDPAGVATSPPRQSGSRSSRSSSAWPVRCERKRVRASRRSSCSRSTCRRRWTRPTSRRRGSRPRRRRRKSFVPTSPKFQVGLVAFDRSTSVLATPTTDHLAVLNALDRLSVGQGTAGGEGLHVALNAVEGQRCKASAPPRRRPRRSPPRPSCCSPTARPPSAARSRTPPPRRSKRACRSRRSPTAPTSGTVASRATSSRYRRIRRRCSRSPTRRAASSSRPPARASSRTSTTTSRPGSATPRAARDPALVLRRRVRRAAGAVAASMVWSGRFL